MKRLVILLTLVVLLLLAATPVYAVPPYIQSGSFAEDDALVNCADVGSWDFIVRDSYVINYRHIYHFNQDSDLVRLNVLLSGDSALYVANNPAKEILNKFKYSWNIYIDPDSGESIHTDGHGNMFNVHLPSYGSLHKMSGAWWFEGGQLIREVGVVAPNPVAICEYFAP